MKISRLMKNIVTKTLKVNFDGAGKKPFKTSPFCKKSKFNMFLINCKKNWLPRKNYKLKCRF